MGIYYDMLDMGLTKDCKFYAGERVDYKGNTVSSLMVDIEYKGNVITLYSENEYNETLDKMAFALQCTFLSSVKLVPKLSNLVLQTSSLFDKAGNFGPPVLEEPKEYFATSDIIYTAEGIYHCANGWADDKERYREVRDISISIRRFGMKDEYQKTLKSLGAIKIIDFSEHSAKSKIKPLYQLLLDKGAFALEELSFHQDRAKSYGHMYDGRGCLELDGITYYFKMWYHHGSETYMTESEVKDNLRLSSINITPKLLKELFPSHDFKDKYGFSTHWYTIQYNGAIFLHPVGWFDTSPATDLLENDTAIVKKKLSIYGLTKDLILELDQLGFKRLI